MPLQAFQQNRHFPRVCLSSHDVVSSRSLPRIRATQKKVLQPAIARLKQKKQSILLVEQDLSFALDVADYAYVLSKGAVVFAGPPEELKRREDVQSRYLGV